MACGELLPLLVIALQIYSIQCNFSFYFKPSGVGLLAPLSLHIPFSQNTPHQNLRFSNFSFTHNSHVSYNSKISPPPPTTHTPAPAHMPIATFTDHHQLPPPCSLLITTHLLSSYLSHILFSLILSSLIISQSKSH